MTQTSTPWLGEDPANRIRQDLLHHLQSGQWPAGSRIPTERALCEHYGVGRSVLRRVLRELRELKLIEQRVGSGTYVAHAAGSASSPELRARATISPAEIMEARLLLEPTLISLIVNNATAADFARFDECCDQAEAADTLEEFEYWDGALHEQLAIATHNAFFVRVFALMTECRNSGEWGVLKKKSVNPERRERYQQEHRALVEALKQRDADTAKRILTDHLMRVRRNLLGEI